MIRSREDAPDGWRALSRLKGGFCCCVYVLLQDQHTRMSVMATNAGRCPLTGTGTTCACADYATLSASRDARCTLHTRSNGGVVSKVTGFDLVGRFFNVNFVVQVIFDLRCALSKTF